MLGWRLLMYVDVNSFYIHICISIYDFKSHHIPSIIILCEFQDVDQGVDSACWCVSTPFKMHNRDGTCKRYLGIAMYLHGCPNDSWMFPLLCPSLSHCRVMDKGICTSLSPKHMSSSLQITSCHVYNMQNYCYFEGLPKTLQLKILNLIIFMNPGTLWTFHFPLLPVFRQVPTDRNQ